MVLPLPGGPQKIIEPGTPRSIASRSGFPGASRCSCPANSSSAARPHPGGQRLCLARGRREQRLLGPRRTALPRHQRIHAFEQALGQEEGQRAAEERRRGEPAALGLELGHQVRRGDVQRDPGGERQPVPGERRHLLGQQHAEHRGDAEHRGAADARARGSARRPPSRSRWSPPRAACAAGRPGRAGCRAGPTPGSRWRWRRRRRTCAA